MPTSWKFLVDWDRDNDFNGEYDDISDWVLTANWFLGMQQPYSSTGDNSRLKVTLQNMDKRFSPDNHASPLAGLLQPFTIIRVVADDGEQERIMWAGYIERITPQVNSYGSRNAELVAAGPMQYMKAASANIRLGENVRTDTILRSLLKAVVIPPSRSRVWILGKSRLGVDTVLGREEDLMSLDEGLLLFETVGDNWVSESSNPQRSTFSVYRAIEDLVAAERGRFFFQRDGKAVFWNREHLLNARNPEASFNDTMQDMHYIYADSLDFKNEIVVSCRPRRRDEDAEQVLWELQTPLSIPPGTTHLEALYQDANGVRIGARQVRVEHGFATESGIVELQAGANQAEVRVRNTSGEVLTLQTCILKGQRILDTGQLEAIAVDTDSITHYGRRVLKIDTRVLSDFAEAQDIAYFELERRKDPRGSVRTLTLRSHALQGGSQHEHQLNLSIGSLIHVEESQSAHVGEYILIGETHRLSRGGMLETQWYLEPAGALWLAHHDRRYQNADYGLNTPHFTRLAQSFTAVDSRLAQDVRLWLRRVGLPDGELQLHLYTDTIVNDGWRLGVAGRGELGVTTKLNSDGNVPGVLLASSEPVVSTTVGEGYGWVSFTLIEPPLLTQGEKYWLVVTRNGTASDTDTITWGVDQASSEYGIGEFKAERRARWVAQDGTACFRVLTAIT